MLNGKFADEEGRLAALRRYKILDTPREKPFDKITKLVQSILEVPISAVSLVDQERQWFKSIQGLEVTETPRSMSFCSHAIQLNEPLVVRNALEDDRFRLNPLVTAAPGIRSYAGVPLQTPDSYNVGALCAIDTEPRDFNDAQIEILKSFAALIVDELELRRIAERDHLTGALTRRGFIQQIENAITRFQRSRQEAVLLLFDIDHFKQVNDRYGHPAGDEVLKAVSAACQGQLRASDTLGRLGGEEFGILLGDANLRGAWGAAEKFRRTIEQTVVKVAGDISVTASFGIATLSSLVLKPNEWISQADEALYSAKRGGRNRCILKDCSKEPIAA